MVAYSFKRMLVPAIRIGLGLDPIDQSPGARRPKRQTIRATGKRRHARPGDTLQLYTGMRTKQCELIGEAQCVGSFAIEMDFDAHEITGGCLDLVSMPSQAEMFATPWCIGDRWQLDAFAVRDGFATWDDLCEFWNREHKDVRRFAGTVIYWEPK